MHKFIALSALSTLKHLPYRLRHWFFQWNQDIEGDIILTIAGCIHLTKYKEHTLVHFGSIPGIRKAEKYQGWNDCN